MKPGIQPLVASGDEGLPRAVNARVTRPAMGMSGTPTLSEHADAHIERDVIARRAGVLPGLRPRAIRTPLA